MQVLGEDVPVGGGQDGHHAAYRRELPGRIPFQRQGFRHYTATHIDPTSDAAEITFGLSATGPGTAWARRLRTGDQIGLLGPGAGIKRPATAVPELLLGDTTALGRGAAANLVPGLEVAPAGPTPGTALAAWLEGQVQPMTGGSTQLPERACLVGHAQSIQQLRKQLRAIGMSRQSITTKAYWANDRKGL